MRPLARSGHRGFADVGAVPPVAVFQIAVDNLSALEELFGAAFAGEVAEAVMTRLDAMAPRAATLEQAGACEFRLVVPKMDIGSAGHLAATLQAEIAGAAIETSRGPVGVTLGIGCAIGRSGPADTLDAAAREALTRARDSGAGAFRLAADHASHLERRATLNRAARAAMGALKDGTLTVAYQPVVRADAPTTPAFHECLARVKADDGDIVAAGDFIPAIERVGLAPLIDRQVLAMAFTTLESHPAARLSVNIFPQTMQDAAWLALFQDRVAAAPDLADRLIIEVTETAAMLDAERTAEFIARIRSTGACFALDDFGAGHTSFRNLRRFCFDMVKLDGAFIDNIETSLDDRFFVRILGEIAERFEMMAVAESVRRPAQARILRDLGIGYLQGYHFGAPHLTLAPASSPGPRIAEI